METRQTVQQVLRETEKAFAGFSPSPRLDAELLLSDILKVSRSYLYAYPDQLLSADLLSTFLHKRDRRLRKEPMAYLLFSQAFWSLSLLVTPATLIPRPETEHLVEWILQRYSAQPPLRVADLGTGSGAIALALACERPLWHIHATDRSMPALQVAIQNARKNGLEQVQFYWGHWCDALGTEKYDLIVSNPPYLDNEDPHLQQLQFEPQDALVAEEGGLSALREIALQAKNHLSSGGCLVLEHGYQQARDLITILEAYGYQNIQSHQDLAQKDRFVTAFGPR